VLGSPPGRASVRIDLLVFLKKAGLS
jgi:hypothetical protein